LPALEFVEVGLVNGGIVEEDLQKSRLEFTVLELASGQEERNALRQGQQVVDQDDYFVSKALVL
jgi:hypothetical protein